MLEELQALDAGQLETAQTENRPVRFGEGDVVALKQNWKSYLEAFFLAILWEDLIAAMMASMSAPCVLTGLNRQRKIR